MKKAELVNKLNDRIEHYKKMREFMINHNDTISANLYADLIHELAWVILLTNQ